MKVTIKTTRTKEAIECSKFIEGMTEGMLQINDDIKMTDIHRLIIKNNYIVTKTDEYGDVMINCKEITTVSMVDENAY